RLRSVRRAAALAEHPPTAAALDADSGRTRARTDRLASRCLAPHLCGMEKQAQRSGAVSQSLPVPALSATGVVKRFDSTVPLDGVSVDVLEGEDRKSTRLNSSHLVISY